jgi:hypothetical protein
VPAVKPLGVTNHLKIYKMTKLLKLLNKFEPKNVQIYDNDGKTYDSITVVFLDTKIDDIFGTRFKTYECLGCSATGVGFFNHSYCQRGLHLGKKVSFKDLTNSLKEKLYNYFNEQNKAA